jgi:hypothetical protein
MPFATNVVLKVTTCALAELAIVCVMELENVADGIGGEAKDIRLQSS